MKKLAVISLFACFLCLIICPNANAQIQSSIISKDACQLVLQSDEFTTPIFLNEPDDGESTKQRINLSQGNNTINLVCSLTQQIVFSLNQKEVTNIDWNSPDSNVERLTSTTLAFLIPAGVTKISFSIEAHHAVNKEFKTQSLQTFLYERIVNNIVMGAFYGLCIVLILYLSFMGRIVSDDTFVFYSIYVFCAAFFFLLQEGQLNIFLPEYAYIFDHTLYILFAGLTVLSATLFISRITDIYKIWPRITYAIMYPAALTVLAISLYLMMFRHGPTQVFISSVMAYLTLGIMFCVLSLIAIQTYRRVPLAWLVCLSLVLMVLGMVFRTFPVIENTFLERYSLVLAFALEALMLAIVVSSRLEAIKFAKVKAEFEANTDQLCEVLNRRGWLKEASVLVEKQIEKGGTLSLLYIDLDGFKLINDKFGHESGDKVLSIVSKIISNQIREEDVLGRVGGDEFVVIGHFEFQSDPKFIADRLKTRFNDMTLHLDNDIAFDLTASVGHVVFSEPPQSISEMLRIADKAMYQRKRERQNISISGDPAF